MAQPLGYRTPDAGDYGWATLPEYPYGELTRGELYSVATIPPRQRSSRVRSRAGRRPSSRGRRTSSACASSAAAAAWRATTCAPWPRSWRRSAAGCLAAPRCPTQTSPCSSGKLSSGQASTRKSELMISSAGSRSTYRLLSPSVSRCNKTYWQQMQPCTGRPLSTPFCDQDQPLFVDRAVFQ